MHAQFFWILYEIPGNIQSRVGNKDGLPLSQCLRNGGLVCGHTHPAHRRWEELEQIYSCHHCFPSFGINFVTGTPAGVYYSVWQQVWRCACIVNSLSSCIRIYTVTYPLFPRACLAHSCSYVYRTRACTMPLEFVAGFHTFQWGPRACFKRFGSKWFLLLVLNF